MRKYKFLLVLGFVLLINMISRLVFIYSYSILQNSILSFVFWLITFFGLYYFLVLYYELFEAFLLQKFNKRKLRMMTNSVSCFFLDVGIFFLWYCLLVSLFLNKITSKKDK